MARQEAPDVKITEALQPRSEMVDTYIRPPQPTRSPLHDVASALQNFSNDISGMFGKMNADQEANNAAQATVDYWTKNDAGGAEATRQGLIPNFAFPGYTKAWNKAAGEAAGVELDGKIGAAYEASGIKTTDDPVAFEAWYRSEVQKNIGSVPSDQARGLAPHIVSSHAKWSSRFQADRIQLTRARGEQSFTAAIGSTLEQHHRAGVGSEGGMDYAAAATNIKRLRDEAYAGGMEKSKADQLAIDAIASVATDRRDERILSIMGSITDPGGPVIGDKGGAANPVSLAETPYGRDKIATQTRAIQASRNSEDERQYTKQQRADKAAKENALRTMTVEWGKNPMWEPPEELLVAGSKADGKFRADAIKIRGEMMAGNVQENPEKIAALNEAILRGRADINDVWAARTAGDLRDPKSISATVALLETAEKNRQAGNPIITSPTFKMFDDQLVAKGADGTSKGSIFGEPGLTKEGMAARLDFRNAVMDFVAKNPQATKAEIEAVIQKFGVAALGMGPQAAPGQPKEGLQRDSGNPTYTQPKALTPAPEAPQNPILPKGETTLAPKTPTATTKVMQLLETAPKAPKVEDLVNQGVAREDFDAFVAKAKALGLPAQKLLDRTYENIQKRKSGLGDTAAAAGASRPTAALDIPGMGRVEFHGVTPEGMEQINGILRDSTGMGWFTPALKAFTGPGAAMKGPVLELPNGMGRANLSGLSPENIKTLEENIPNMLPGAKIIHPSQGKRSEAPLPDETPKKASLTTPGNIPGAGVVDFEGLDTEAVTNIRNAALTAGAAPSPIKPGAQYASLTTGTKMQDPKTAPSGTPLEIARQFMGKNETDNNKELAQFFKKAGGDHLDPAKTAWCARFVNSVLAASGQKGTGKDTARSFLNIGDKIAKPTAGDIAVFPRGNSTWQGHVGIVLRVEGDHVVILGGNQGGKAQKGGGVTEARFPISSALGFRRISTKVAAAMMANPNSEMA